MAVNRVQVAGNKVQVTETEGRDTRDRGRGMGFILHTCTEVGGPLISSATSRIRLAI